MPNITLTRTDRARAMETIGIRLDSRRVFQAMAREDGEVFDGDAEVEELAHLLRLLHLAGESERVAFPFTDAELDRLHRTVATDLTEQTDLLDERNSNEEAAEYQRAVGELNALLTTLDGYRPRRKHR